MNEIIRLEAEAVSTEPYSSSGYITTAGKGVIRSLQCCQPMLPPLPTDVAREAAGGSVGGAFTNSNSLALLCPPFCSSAQIAKAKQEAAAVLARAEARAQALGVAVGRQRTSEGAELVEASMRRLSEAEELVEQPSTLMKR